MLKLPGFWSSLVGFSATYSWPHSLPSGAPGADQGWADTPRAAWFTAAKSTAVALAQQICNNGHVQRSLKICRVAPCRGRPALFQFKQHFVVPQLPGSSDSARSGASSATAVAVLAAAFFFAGAACMRMASISSPVEGLRAGTVVKTTLRPGQISSSSPRSFTKAWMFVRFKMMPRSYSSK